MLSEVSNGLVDTSVAAISVTLERTEIVDFPAVTYIGWQDVILKRPEDNEAGTHYHTLEFRVESWIGVAVTYIVSYVLVTILLVTLKRKNHGTSLSSTATTTMGMCARMFISKVLNFTTFSRCTSRLFLGEYSHYGHIELPDWVFDCLDVRNVGFDLLPLSAERRTKCQDT